ncbi:MAG TPA: hypothetical protein PKZ32_17235, partial [Candidatus Melainabacteria bacterium]|nr:hypothetical protein [Candidatus Melainabacteria bacterium]
IVLMHRKGGTVCHPSASGLIIFLLFDAIFSTPTPAIESEDKHSQTIPTPFEHHTQSHYRGNETNNVLSDASQSSNRRL